MKNITIASTNYTNIGGKAYAMDDFACNYPVGSQFNDSVTVTNGSTLITTTGDFTLLLGGDLQNTNVPVYKWLVTSGGIVLEISHLLSATRAILKYPCQGATGTYGFQNVDYFGQPAVEQTRLIDISGAGAINTVDVFGKFGGVRYDVYSSNHYELGSDPYIFSMTTSPTAGFNVLYTS